jgi:hypothetical protein
MNNPPTCDECGGLMRLGGRDYQFDRLIYDCEDCDRTERVRRPR